MYKALHHVLGFKVTWDLSIPLRAGGFPKMLCEANDTWVRTPMPLLREVVPTQGVTHLAVLYDVKGKPAIVTPLPAKHTPFTVLDIVTLLDAALAERIQPKDVRVVETLIATFCQWMQPRLAAALAAGTLTYRHLCGDATGFVGSFNKDGSVLVYGVDT